jgi:hypothetical protein
VLVGRDWDWRSGEEKRPAIPSPPPTPRAFSCTMLHVNQEIGKISWEKAKIHRGNRDAQSAKENVTDGNNNPLYSLFPKIFNFKPRQFIFQ